MQQTQSVQQETTTTITTVNVNVTTFQAMVHVNQTTLWLTQNW